MINILKEHPYISQDVSIEQYSFPYHHYVLHNVFNEDIYNLIVNDCIKNTKRTKRYCDLENSKTDYAGKLENIPNEKIKKGTDFFTSDLWKEFNEQIFDLILTKYIALSFHVHDAPAKKGFLHSDFNICSFMKTKKKYQLINAPYANDEDDDFVKVMRSVAFLYYFNNNPELSFTGDGGTDIFDDKRKLFNTIKATNNSLLCFEITPITYHAFAGSSYDRFAIVGWLHSTPAKAIRKNIDLVRKKFKPDNTFSEKWPNKTYWPFTKDVEFNTLFNEDAYKIAKEFNLPIFEKKTNILILGGTQMFGRAFVERLLEKKKDINITLANRNITNPELFPSTEHILIDRNNKKLCKELSRQIEYDLVVDFSCYNIDQFKNTHDYLRYKKYVFVSTISAQANSIQGMNNQNPLKEYAIKKREVENYIVTLDNCDDIIIYRPCALYGKNDYTQRFEEKNGKFYIKNSDYCVSDDTSGMYTHVNRAADIILSMVKKCI